MAHGVVGRFLRNFNKNMGQHKFTDSGTMAISILIISGIDVNTAFELWNRGEGVYLIWTYQGGITIS